jgi:hypothetical protein
MGRNKSPDSYRETAAFFGVPKTSLERWSRQCRINLSDRIAVGLMLRRKPLTPEVRKSVAAALEQLGVKTAPITLPRFPK